MTRLLLSLCSYKSLKKGRSDLRNSLLLPKVAGFFPIRFVDFFQENGEMSIDTKKR